MVVRKVWAWEHERMRAHLLRLDPEDRRLRFCRKVSDEFIHRYCDEIDRQRMTAVGFFSDGAMRGAAEMVRIPDSNPMGAEIAVSVESDFQGRGVGGRLLQKVLLLARNRFIDTVYMISLRENEKIQHLVRKFGARVDSQIMESEGCITLPWPSYVSQLEEIASDGQALVGAVFEPSIEDFASAPEQHPGMQA